jgi:hypothetical protein
MIQTGAVLHFPGFRLTVTRQIPKLDACVTGHIQE